MFLLFFITTAVTVFVNIFTFLPVFRLNVFLTPREKSTVLFMRGSAQEWHLGRVACCCLQGPEPQVTPQRGHILDPQVTYQRGHIPGGGTCRLKPRMWAKHGSCVMPRQQ